MTPEQEARFIEDFRRCLPLIKEGKDPAEDYPDGWLTQEQDEDAVE